MYSGKLLRVSTLIFKVSFRFMNILITNKVSLLFLVRTLLVCANMQI